MYRCFSWYQYFLKNWVITLKNDFRASLPINLPVISIFFIPFSCDHLQIHEVDQPYHSKNLRNFHAGSDEEYISISSNVKIRHCISNGTGTTGKRFRVKYEVVGTYFLLIIRCYQKRNFYNAISIFKNITKSYAYSLEQYLLTIYFKVSLLRFRYGKINLCCNSWSYNFYSWITRLRSFFKQLTANI